MQTTERRLPRRPRTSLGAHGGPRARGAAGLPAGAVRGAGLRPDRGQPRRAGRAEAPAGRRAERRAHRPHRTAEPRRRVAQPVRAVQRRQTRPHPQQQRSAGAKPAGRLDQRQPAVAAGGAAGAHHPQRGHGRRRVAVARHHRSGRQPRRHRGRQPQRPSAPAWSPAGRNRATTARSQASTCGRVS